MIQFWFLWVFITLVVVIVALTLRKEREEMDKGEKAAHKSTTARRQDARGNLPAPLWGSSLRAPSVAGDLPPPHRRTGFPQPPATLLPPNHARQACGPAARPARRSAAPRQQQQPGLRAASSSAEHGESGHRIFVPRPGHTVKRRGPEACICIGGWRGVGTCCEEVFP